MLVPNRNNINNNYRYAYQGQEKDPETGKEAFELRLWDARIGRWLTTDPYGEFHSPYLGMGNNPISNIDPDGGCIDCPPLHVVEKGDSCQCSYVSDSGNRITEISRASDFSGTTFEQLGYDGNLGNKIDFSSDFSVMRITNGEWAKANQDVLTVMSLGLMAVDLSGSFSLISSSTSLARPKSFNFTSTGKTGFNINNPSSFKGASSSSVKSFVNAKWNNIDPAKKGGLWRSFKPNTKGATNIYAHPGSPGNKSLPLIKQGPYLRGTATGGVRIPLRGNPSL